MKDFEDFTLCELKLIYLLWKNLEKEIMAETVYAEIYKDIETDYGYGAIDASTFEKEVNLLRQKNVVMPDDYLDFFDEFDKFLNKIGEENFRKYIFEI